MPLTTTLAGSSFPYYICPFSLGDITFTAAMAVRSGFGGFDTAPIYQGKWDGTGTPDVVSFPRGTLLGNQTQYFYSNFDPYQGTISFWIRPEWDGDDGIEHNIAYASSNYRVYKSSGNALVLIAGGQTYTGPSTAAWAAGTAYCVQGSWDTRNTIDGTNYARWSVNDAHTYSMTTQPTASAPDASVYVGSTSTPTLSADAMISSFCVSRIVWYDGTYGVPMWFDESGAVDVINAIYAAGAGADPAQIFGSWDVCGFLPTDQTEGALQTTGQAWSHPHGSELIDVPFVDDGGLPGTDYAVEFNGSNTVIDCGSDVDIDDLHDNAFTFECWIRADSSDGRIVSKRGGSSVGWALSASGTYGLYGLVYCATTNADVGCGTDDFSADGKWHHITMFFDDAGDRKIYLAIDGRWATSYSRQVAGVGAVVSDAAKDLVLGLDGSVFTGGIAWAAISNNDRHVHGTDFIPPRAFPADDANYVASWAMDEGTGVAVANTGNQGGAGSGAANRDGTIANGSWSAIWAIVGTPEIPQSLQFFQENDGIDFGSGANIDDLPSADCTIEFWAKVDEYVVNTFMLSKSDSFTNGWSIFCGAGGLVGVRVIHGGGNCSITTAAGVMEIGKWYHIAVDWDVGTLTGRLFVRGEHAGSSTAAGAYTVDAGEDCLANSTDSIGTGDGNLSIGWVRLSDTRRYTGNSFIPPARNNPPANDGNAQLLINMDDGAGTTATDSSGNAYDGTITFGTNTRWNNTPDLAIDESGAMIYEQGYNLGSDGANDGMYIPHTLTASTDYVIRAPLNYSPNAWPRITLYDVTAAGSIVDFDAPPMTAVHDGAGNAAAFTSTGEVYPASLIGGTIYNVTDGSSGTITAVGGTNQDTITATLAGGTDNDWDVADQAYIVPSDGWVFNEPIVARTSANTAYELRITNRNSDGIITTHLAEVLESLIANGDHESLTGGNPDLITGWTNNGLDAGDTEAEAAMIHAGAQSLEWNPGSVLGEGMYETIATTAGKYLTFAGWTVGDDTDGFRIGELDGAEALLHNSATLYRATTSVGSVWTHTPMVLRALDTSPELQIEADAITGDGFSDDFYAFECDAVTLTVTAATQANSLEGTGIRVDGRDSATVPATAHRMKAASGAIAFRVTPRHSLALAQGFGQSHEYLLDLTEDANNYLRLYRTTNTLTLAVNQAGAGEVTDTDATAWAADTEVLIVVKNMASRIDVERDGVVVCQLTGLAGFAADFTAAAYFGSDTTPDHEADAVISPP